MRMHIAENGQKESFGIIAKLSWNGQILCKYLQPMVLDHHDFMFINIFLDSSYCVAAKKRALIICWWSIQLATSNRIGTTR